MLSMVEVLESIRQGMETYREVFCREDGLDLIQNTALWTPATD